MQAMQQQRTRVQHSRQHARHQHVTPLAAPSPVCSHRVRALASSAASPAPPSAQEHSQPQRRRLYARAQQTAAALPRVVLCRCQAEQQQPASAGTSSSASESSSSSSTHPFPEEEDFDLLSNRVAALTAELKDDLKGCSIYLIGMMGSGKSTVGKMLANTLKYAFFDTDTMVEMTHDKKPVSEIFKEYGQDYFRTCESEVLKQLAPYKNLVISTGGGVVIKPMNWSYMHNGVVVWLNGPTHLLAQRVAKDGIAKRPLLAPAPGEEPAGPSGASEEERLYQTAKSKLDTLLEERTKYYENADLKVSLEGYGLDAQRGAPTAVVMYRLLTGLKQKIDATKQEREERRNFTIEQSGEVPTMRVQPPLGGAADVPPAEGGQAA